MCEKVKAAANVLVMANYSTYVHMPFLWVQDNIDVLLMWASVLSQYTEAEKAEFKSIPLVMEAVKA